MWGKAVSPPPPSSVYLVRTHLITVEIEQKAIIVLLFCIFRVVSSFVTLQSLQFLMMEAFLPPSVEQR